MLLFLRFILFLLTDYCFPEFPPRAEQCHEHRVHPFALDLSDIDTIEFLDVAESQNLGVVRLREDDDRTYVVADIPGLIEGAHLGHGLGIQFLRHVERTSLLAHLVDVSESSGRDPVQDFHVVMQELENFSDELAKKPMVVVATKLDAAQDSARLTSLAELAEGLGLPFFSISSVTGEGVEKLKFAMAERVFTSRLSDSSPSVKPSAPL